MFELDHRINWRLTGRHRLRGLAFWKEGTVCAKIKTGIFPGKDKSLAGTDNNCSDLPPVDANSLSLTGWFATSYSSQSTGKKKSQDEKIVITYGLY